ncbi:MAG: ribonuclease HI family protein [Planctomycetota bacterium]
MKAKIEVYIDGASRGNPGPSAVGIFIRESSGKEIVRRGEYIGEVTNNVAEYTALIRALKYLLDHPEIIGTPLRLRKKLTTAARGITIYSDSELLVKQIKGDYRIRSENLIPLSIEARGLLKKIPAVEFNLIPREENKVADKLANKAMNIRGEIDELSRYTSGSNSLSLRDSLRS